MKKLFIIPVVILFLFSCKSSEEFSGFSYDPPGVTNTSDKKIEFQKRRVIGAGSPKVWVGNEFLGARMNDFYAIDDTTFRVVIAPENSPINNSPWYSFRIWGQERRKIRLQLAYKDGRHRYQPKVYFESNIFSAIPVDSLYPYPVEVLTDTATGYGSFDLVVGESPLIVTAQYPFNTLIFSKVLVSPSIQQLANTKVIGFSHYGRPIYEIEVDQTSKERKGVLVILSRQHPPEVSGFMASLAFLEELLSNSELANRFRDHFIIKAYPMINPDGVDNGHWRHNAAGVDLNRDWVNFNQPETRAVRDALLPILQDSLKTVYYGIDFHSTDENIFYPIYEDIQTFPDNVTQRWFKLIVESHPDIPFNYEEFDTRSPIAKNWLYRTFGADAVTFEVDDELNAFDIETMAKNSAQHLMKLLLNEYIKKNY